MQNKLVRKFIGTEETVVANIIKSRLRWFGHVICKDEDSYIG